LISSPDRGDGLCRATAQSPSCLSAVRSAWELVLDFVPRRPADAPAPTYVPVPRALRLRKVTVLCRTRRGPQGVRPRPMPVARGSNVQGLA